MFKQNESIAFIGINEPITYMNEEEISNGYSFIFVKEKTKKMSPNVLKKEKYTKTEPRKGVSESAAEAFDETQEASFFAKS